MDAVWDSVDRPVEPRSILAHDAEPGCLVQASRSAKLALSPEHELAVARLSGEAHALAHQTRPEARPPRLRLYQQQAQLGHRLRPLDEEYRADRLAPLLKDNGIRFAYPTLIWWNARGEMRGCACEKRQTYRFVRNELGA